MEGWVKISVLFYVVLFLFFFFFLSCTALALEVMDGWGFVFFVSTCLERKGKEFIYPSGSLPPI